MKLSLRRFSSFGPPLLVVVALAAVTAACGSSSDTNSLGAVDNGAISWVSPTPDAAIDSGDAVVLSVQVDDASATTVRFDANGQTVATCDTSNGPDECHLGNLFRMTTTFPVAGPVHLVATLVRASGNVDTSLDITVLADGAPDDADGGTSPVADGGKKDGGASDGGTTAPAVNRGFLDPARASHDVFGGVSWAVTDDVVVVTAPPTGSVTEVASCMKTYGTSIVKWADYYKISRASVVATAIAESNCTDPSGSSDGLSAGPLQVTGSTCASLVSGYTSASCKSKMYASADFSFEVGAKYMGSTYQLGQSQHDPPKIGAAYNAGSIQESTANRWHMLVTGNHIERWTGAYNAYRAWEKLPATAQSEMAESVVAASEKTFDGEHVEAPDALPASAREGQVYFVGNWQLRDGQFMRFANGGWQAE